MTQENEEQVQKIVEEVLKEILSDTGFQMWKDGSDAFKEEIEITELAVRKTAEKIKEEIDNYRKQLVIKSSENHAKDLLINTGKILALKDLQEIFKAKFGAGKK